MTTYSPASPFSDCTGCIVDRGPLAPKTRWPCDRPCHFIFEDGPGGGACTNGTIIQRRINGLCSNAGACRMIPSAVELSCATIATAACVLYRNGNIAEKDTDGAWHTTVPGACAGGSKLPAHPLQAQKGKQGDGEEEEEEAK